MQVLPPNKTLLPDTPQRSTLVTKLTPYALISNSYIASIERSPSFTGEHGIHAEKVPTTPPDSAKKAKLDFYLNLLEAKLANPDKGSSAEVTEVFNNLKASIKDMEQPQVRRKNFFAMYRENDVYSQVGNFLIRSL